MSALCPFAAVLGVCLALAPTLALAQPSLEQMAGQMIIVGFQGDSAGDKAVLAVREEIASGGIGGVMYLKTNVASLASVREMNAAFRAASPSLLPFITIDQEGGAVERLTKEVGFKEVPSAAEVAKTMDVDEARNLYRTMADGLAAQGFTVNFGPVADVDVNPQNPIIGKFGRAFSEDAWAVFQYNAAFIEAHHEAGIVTALKHFPGHGSSTGDSHEGFVDISRTWEAHELAPYKYLLSFSAQAPVDMVMVGHLYNGAVGDNGDRTPSSLSPYWIGKVLRGDIKFDGVVITDDLEMGAIRQRFDLKETVVRAVRAGVDILLFSNTAKPRASLPAEVRAILVAEAEADPDFRARIEKSYARIVDLKQRIRPATPVAAVVDAPIPADRPTDLRAAVQ